MYTTPIIGNNIIKLDAVDSTNTYAATLLKNQNPAEGLVIYAKEQLNGRGQMGTKWHAIPNQSLTFSAILTPSFLPIDKQFYLNMAISLGVFEYLKAYELPELYIKWPNDMLANGRKLAGILIENSIAQSKLKQSIVGIGLNLQGISSIDKIKVASIAEFTNEEYQSEVELAKLCSWLDKFYMQLRMGKFDQLKEAYMSQLWGYDSEVPLIIQNKESTGKVLDIHSSGQIEMIIDGSVKTINFKEVTWIL